MPLNYANTRSLNTTCMDVSNIFCRVFLAILMFVYTTAVTAANPYDFPPMADIHLHYNWSQEEVTSPEEAVRQLKKHNVTLAVVSSRPSANALKLQQAGGDWIIPIYSPYFKPGIKETWFIFPEVLVHTRKALASGKFKGIGEMHLVPGMGPRRDNKVVQGLFKLAAEFNVPVLIHTDTSKYEYLLPICKQHKKVRFLWAHAGGILLPADIDPLMAACPNVSVELSARDPLHYGYFVDPGEKLSSEWRNLFMKYPLRFMTGTDPVLNAHQTYRWHEPDEGWSHYGKLNIFHRNWMRQLPANVEKNIRLLNAQRFFGVKGLDQQ